jgi:hypothetical protein
MNYYQKRKARNHHPYILWLMSEDFKKLKTTAQSEFKGIPRFIMDLLNFYLKNKNHE